MPEPMQNPKYSIVIPAFNEAARIPATLESVVARIRARGWDAEVIIVDDGSRDRGGCPGVCGGQP